MKFDLTQPKASNFEAAGKDLKDIMFRLLENEELIKILHYNVPNALEQPSLTVEEKKLLLNDKIRVVPILPTEEEESSYIIVSFDTFTTNEKNQLFRDNYIIFDILCNTGIWTMEDYMLRPYKIMHYIDAMFNNKKLNGIGKVDFVIANSLILSEKLSGFSMSYRVINDV